MRSGFIPAVLIAMLTACTSDPLENATFDMSTADALIFVIGQPGIQADVDRIQAGDKLGEMWTYMEIPSSVVDPRTRSGSVSMNAPGIIVAHEFFSADPTDPTTAQSTPADFRIDFTTSASSTIGTLTFDRDPGGAVYFRVMYKGYSTAYGPPIYVEFEITTGFPVQSN